MFGQKKAKISDESPASTSRPAADYSQHTGEPPREMKSCEIRAHLTPAIHHLNPTGKQGRSSQGDPRQYHLGVSSLSWRVQARSILARNLLVLHQLKVVPMTPAPRQAIVVVVLLLLLATTGAAVAASGGGGGGLYFSRAHHRRSRATSGAVAAAALLPAAHRRQGRGSRQLAMAASKPLAALKSLASRYSSWLVRFTQWNCVLDAHRVRRPRSVCRSLP